LTGNRADYGHLYWVMREVYDDPSVHFQLVVTGAHLCSAWGYTVRAIEEDGFRIDARVEMQLSGDSGIATAKSIGLGIIGLADAFDRLAPDLLVLLGDRYEILAAAQAAMTLKIPIGHIHGGEVTTGAIDELIRHAVTKMSHLHFVAAAPYRHRILQLGENPSTVFDFGAPGLDHLKRSLIDERELVLSALNIPKHLKIFVVSYHPTTLASKAPADSAKELVNALKQFDGIMIVFTSVNSDPGNASVRGVINKFASEHRCSVRIFDSLGQARYLGLLKIADVIIGNSSSGLIEAPALNLPSVNIGERQSGRIRAASVIDCGDDQLSIVNAITRALSPGFRSQIPVENSQYGLGDASSKIGHVLKSFPLSNLLVKNFFTYQIY